MKKEATKKSKMWIWLIAGLAVLVAAGVLTFVLLSGNSASDSTETTAVQSNNATVPTTGEEAEADGPRAKLYWNLDRKFYTENSESGLSTRTPGEDGIYRVRYAYNGDVVELPIADKQLVNFIDTMDCMGVVLDDNGTVIDVVDPKTLATETARMFYVRKTEEGKLMLNSSMAMNGMNMDVVLTELAEIYDVAPNAEKPGAVLKATDLESMDAVTIYSNAESVVTHVYVVSHPVESPVYWRADNNKYSSSLKETTRTPDAEGYYTIPFYCDGELVELKCNIKGIVNTIDSKNRYKAHTGLVLDENGHIVDNMLAATGIRGLLGCEMFDVTEINGDSFVAEALITGSGDTYEGTITADTKIYDISLATDPALRGKEAEGGLKIGDRIAVFENANGDVQLIYIGHRTVDAPMYFNVTKQYDSTNKTTKRTADANGWYTIEMMSEGVIKTYKTQDKSIMDFIDSQNNRSVGLILEGDVIVRAYEGECIAGYGAMVGYTIKNVTGSILSMYPSTDANNVSNRILNAGAKVYNMSGVKQEKGATTTLQNGDYCILWRNAKSEIVYAYVIKRLVNAPVYFSLTRKWDSTTQQTTRVPNAEGWYVYECMSEGKPVTVKTQSKKVADFLDSQGPQTFALHINSEGVILDYFETHNVYGGSKSYLNTIVKKITADGLVLYNPTNEKVYTPKVAADCKVWNFSTVYDTIRGEKTKVAIDDNIQCYTNAKGEIAMILVRQRKAEGDIYFSKNRIKPVDGKLVREPDAEGWYVFECTTAGKQVTVKTKDANIALLLDSQSPRGFALQVDADGVIKKAYDARAVIGGSTAALNHDVTAIDGKNISTYYTVDGKAHSFKLASKCKVYNVSSNYEDHWGETATLKVGDQIQCYTNQTGEIVYIYITVRPAEAYMGWNVDPNKGSVRVPDADGLYTVQLAVNGQIKTYKVDGEKAISYIDSANGAVAIGVKNNVIISAQSAIYGPGIWTSTEAAVIANVLEVNGNTLKIKDSKGAERDMVLASNFACYDVSGKGAFKGAAATPAVGNYGRMYLNVNKEVVFFYIMPASSSGGTVTPSQPEEPQVPAVKEYDNSNLVFEEGTTRAYCTYCEETVEWTALETTTANTTLEDGVHYYLAENLENNASYYNITGTNCVHLNGKNVTSANRVFAVATTGHLNVMGNGVVTGSNTATGTANVAGATISIRNSINLIGGTYKHANSTLPTIIMAKPQQTMNIYKDVKIEGTEGVTGTNLYVMFGVVNMYGGEITGGTATPNGTTKGRGDNVYVYGLSGTTPARAEFNMYGGLIDGGIYAEKNSETFKFIVAGDAVITANKGGLTLDAQTDARLTLGALTDNAKIYVSGQGNLTKESVKAQQYLNAGIIAAADPAVELTVQNDVIVAPIVEDIPDPEEMVWVLAWVVDPKFDATNEVTTRTPDSEGYYYVELSVDGITKTYKTKVTGLGGQGDGIDYVDQSGSKDRAVAICLKSATSDEFVEALGATNHTGAKGAKVTTITAIEGDIIRGEGYEAKLAADAKIFDVSDHATAEGELSTLKVGDYVRFYTTESGTAGDILYGYIYTRVGAVEPEPTGLQLYWNVDRMDGGDVSTRTPDADGWYYIDLAVNGEIKTFKTQNKNIIDYIDAKNGGATALTVDGNVITASASALEGEGVAAAGKSGTVTEIAGVKVILNNPTEGELNVNMAANVKIYDVSGKSEFIGQATELKVGDSFRSYNNADGEMLYIYILARAAEPTEPEAVDMNEICAKADAMAAVFANGGEVEAECPVCAKTVTWKPMPTISGSTKLATGHYYFASDVNVSAGFYSITEGNPEVCIHLNGKTFQNTGTANTRSFYVEGAKVNIMGSGNVIGARGASAAAERCGSTLEIVGVNTEVNVCGGTWSKTNDALDVMGIRGRGTSVINIYDGTVINIGEVQGNALWIAGGNVNLYGGEVNGDVYARTYTAAGAQYETVLNLTISGITVNGKLILDNSKGAPFTVTLSGDSVIEELVTDSTLPLNIGRMTVGADVKITAEGAFTNANPNLQDYVDAGFLTAKAEGKIITVTEGIGAIADAPKAQYDNSDLVFEEGTTRAYCTYCKDTKEWTALQSTADGSTDTLGTEGGHFYLTEDMLENKGRYNITATTCVHLNGHNITNTANRAFSLNKNISMTIMGNGVVTGSYNGTATANVAASTISSLGELTLIGGTYVGAESSTLPTILEARGAEKYIKIYDGVTITGGADKAGLCVAYGHLVMYGGTIDRLDVLGYDIGGTHAQCSATLLGGTVEKFYMAARDPEGQYKNYLLSLTVGGTAKATVELAQGAKITISEEGMKKGAEIVVTAVDGAITAESTKAADYLALGYFKAADEAKTITEKDGILSIG